MSEAHLTSNAPPFRLRLPATSANLGPGFDTLGLALSLDLVIEARPALTITTIHATGRNPELCGSLTNNLILMTYGEIFRDLGLAAPALSLKVHNQIPLGMGLGSSAAAIVAGVCLANHFGQLHWTPQEILDDASEREGHPDNVAACLGGGLTVSGTTDVASSEGKRPATVAASFGHKLAWKLHLAIPQTGLSTASARSVLPPTYSRGDTIANLQATALLVSAFALDRPDLLGAATRDRIHQPFRGPLCPLLPALLPLAGHHGILSVTLSGAGPSVLLISKPDAPADQLTRVIHSAAGDHLSELLVLAVGQAAGPVDSIPLP